MTRKEYMRALEEALSFLGDEQRAALLEYYGEMIDDRMEDGMDEASAVAAMESPEEIAAQQRAEEPKREAAPAFGNEAMEDEALKFSSTEGDILNATERILDQASGNASFPKTAEESYRQEAERIRRKEEEMRRKEEAARREAVRQGEEAIRQAAETIRQEAERIGQEVKEAAQETDFGDYRQQTLSCPADSLRAVRLACGEMPIVVDTAEGGKATLVYYTCDNDPYEAEVRDGVLTLRRAEIGGSRAGRVTVSVLGSIIRLAWNKPTPTVELHLPASALLDLEARTSNASIKLKGPRALCAVTLKTSNGRIALEDVKCISLDAAASNARLTLEKVEAKQSLNGKSSNGRIEAVQAVSGGGMTLTTSNGRIEATGAVSHGDMALTTSNSRIEANGCSAQGEMRLITSNGTIKFSGVNAQAVTLKTSNSSISGTLPGRQTDWQIDSGTSNGRNNLPAHQPGEKPLRAHTSNGSVDVRFEE